MYPGITRPTLRNRDKLEEQIAAEIALGALNNLEGAIKNKHEAALEYGAQLLFNNIRLEIAQKSNLPTRIACYLLFDRELKIRHAVVDSNFFNLPEEFQEAYLTKTEQLLIKVEKHTEIKHDVFGSPRTDVDYMVKCLKTLFIKSITNGNDALAHRILNMPHMDKIINQHIPGEPEQWRNLPKTIEFLYNVHQDKHLPDDVKYPYIRKIFPTEFGLVHPDEEVRFNTVKEALKLKSDDLRTAFREIDKKVNDKRYYHQGRKGNIKDAVFTFVADDPSLKVLRLIVSKVRQEKTLRKIAEKVEISDPDLAKKALKNADKIAKRTAYTIAYKEKKEAERKRA